MSKETRLNDEDAPVSPEIEGNVVDAETPDNPAPTSNSEKGPSCEPEEVAEQDIQRPAGSPDPESSSRVYSIFTPAQRSYIAVSITLAAFFSPVSTTIYLPALNTLVRELSVSISLMNLTFTSYLVGGDMFQPHSNPPLPPNIFQAIAPMFMGDFADTAGRRPAILLCFVISVAACVGLALQTNYLALFIHRCVQAVGSSPTIVLATGVVADVATSDQRGTYIGWITAGALLGLAIGPVVGGVLTQHLGWRANFWSLAVFSAAFLVSFVIFFPETGRHIVGDGSHPPQKWNISVITHLARKSVRRTEDSSVTFQAPTDAPRRPKLRFPNPIKSLVILREKDTLIILLTNAIMIGAFYDINVSVTSLFHDIYGYNDFQIGLCYIPFGMGACIGSIANGFLLDYNYSRIARELGVPIVRNRQQDLRHFPVERARLQTMFPLMFVSVCAIVAFGWVLHFRVSIAAPLVLLFISGATITGTVNTVSTLLVDLHPGKVATVTASNNLVRCLVSAGATAVISPMISGMGVGWCYTLIGFIIAATSPAMLVGIRSGPKRREQKRLNAEAQSAG
ncbi:MFS transporter [Histoplasma capsulatum]|uniref:MFS transporter n=1 Tax=Ajellomyces capsulatus TaxID=5037 RepID=A0A8A1M8B3_AJECA|nr:MFS transporter [Histoplasma capsulatum]